MKNTSCARVPIVYKMTAPPSLLFSLLRPSSSLSASSLTLVFSLQSLYKCANCTFYPPAFSALGKRKGAKTQVEQVFLSQLLLRPSEFNVNGKTGHTASVLLFLLHTRHTHSLSLSLCNIYWEVGPFSALLLFTLLLITLSLITTQRNKNIITRHSRFVRFLLRPVIFFSSVSCECIHLFVSTRVTVHQQYHTVSPDSCDFNRYVQVNLL